MTFTPGTVIRFTWLKGKIDPRPYVAGATFPPEYDLPEFVELHRPDGTVCGCAETSDLEPVA